MIKQGWSHSPAFVNFPRRFCLVKESPSNPNMEYMIIIDFEFEKKQVHVLISSLFFFDDFNKSHISSSQEINFETGGKVDFSEFRYHLLRLMKEMPDEDLLSF
jgi:hypothetical protein